MNRALSIVTVAVLLLMGTGCATAPATMPRPADQIVADIEAVEFPRFDMEKRGDAEYQTEFEAAYEDSRTRQAALVLELYEADPENERLPRLFQQRWQPMMWGGGDRTDELRRELARLIDDRGDTELGLAARFARAQLAMRETLFVPERNVPAALAAIEEFIAAAPQDGRGASLLMQAAGALETGDPKQVALYERVKAKYPENRNATFASGKLRQAKSIGKPFDLAFTCAVNNTEIDMATLRGKVVVIDFWATWCGPCVAKMPQFKELYAKYHDQGLEIVGVSLDHPEERGGLERLLAFVEENEIPWPQFYQGHGWDSEFSTGWGINGIPTIFVVDKRGNLRSTTARAGIEEFVAELLQEPYPDKQIGG